MWALERESEEVEDDPPLEDKYLGADVENREGDPPLIEGHNGQTLCQRTRRLLWKNFDH